MTHSGGLGAAPISKLGLFHPRGLRVPTSARSSGWSSSPVFSQEEEASPGFADPPLPRALAGPPAARLPQACGCHGFQAARRGPRGPAQGAGLGKAARELTACTQPPGRRGQLHTGNVLPAPAPVGGPTLTLDPQLLPQQHPGGIWVLGHVCWDPRGRLSVLK